MIDIDDDVTIALFTNKQITKRNNKILTNPADWYWEMFSLF
jgi:hypothetical protein